MAPGVLKTLGRYEILRDLGRGGMASVYLARQTDLDRFVALKELHAFHTSDAAAVQRFLRESRMAGGLSHPNVVVVHDYFEHEGTPYIAMEYVESGSLRPHIGHLTLAQIVGVLEGLLAGLAHAEQHGIVHRDLKPENLMITADGRVKIADFGIAKATHQMRSGAFMTATGTTVGTPTYMAPEQAMAQEVGPWTDLYSVGVMAFEMFVGRPPFRETEPMATLLRHVNEDIPPVKSLVPDVDEGISDWIQLLAVKDPAARWRSAGAAWDELEEITIRTLGPRWRRGARLVDRGRQVDTPKPLTPAPFHSTSRGEAVPEELDGLPVGDDTPVPSESGFITYGRPAARGDPAAGESPDAVPTEPAPREPPPAVPAEPAAEEPPQPVPPEAAPVLPIPAPDPPQATPADPDPLLDPASVAPVPADPAPDPALADTAMPASLRTRPPHAPARAAAGPRRAALVMVGVTLTAALAGVAIATFTGPDPPDGGAPTVRFSSGNVGLLVPQGWSTVAAPPSIPGVDPARVTALAPGGRDGGTTVVFGQLTDADNPSLLPGGLLDAVGGPPQERTPVKLGRLEAYRYVNLRPRGLARRLTIYAVPSSGGVATLACLGFGDGCERIAGTLRLTRVTPYSVGPSKAYAASIGRALSDLDRKVRPGIVALRRARRPRTQAKAARSLETAYREAATTIGALETSPADRGLTRGFASALRWMSSAHRGLADAAANADRREHRRARAGIGRAERGLADALKRFEAAGYRVRG